MESSVTIKEKLKSYCGLSCEVVVLCIGSDRITGDCLGPMVGQLLVRYYNIPAFVYGTLDSPVTALNLKSVIKGIRLRHGNSRIIAVDSSVGEAGDVGTIATMRGSLSPGSADGKDLPRVGHVSITAVTSDQAPSSAGFMSVRLGFVYTLAQSIAKGIHMFFDEKQQSYTPKASIN